MDLAAYLQERRRWVEEALEGYLPTNEAGGEVLAAMRYSLFAGGKRLRPILCLAGAEAVAGDPGRAMYCACALEMIHSYSLVHDDLPAMDDDDFRRGVPTSHKVFGEGMAVLAGDGLLSQAALLLCRPGPHSDLPPERVLAAAAAVLAAAGYQGMVGGQAADLLAEGQTPDLARVQFVHSHKTGALIAAAAHSGAILGGGDPEQVETLLRYGRRIGLAFQIADDLLNLEGKAEELGKAVGSDRIRGKMTYPAVVGPSAARQAGEKLVAEATALVAPLGPAAEPLAQLAGYIMQRTR